MHKFLFTMNNLLTQQGCPNRACESYGKSSDVAVHDKKLNRLRCKICDGGAYHCQIWA